MHLSYWNTFVVTSGGYSDQRNRQRSASVAVNMTEYPSLFCCCFFAKLQQMRNTVWMPIILQTGFGYPMQCYDMFFFFPHFASFPNLSSYLLRLFLCLISFLLFPCLSVWETLVHEFPIFYSHTEWYISSFFMR